MYYTGVKSGDVCFFFFFKPGNPWVKFLVPARCGLRFGSMNLVLGVSVDGLTEVQYSD